jgi:hypothetical protein
MNSFRGHAVGARVRSSSVIHASVQKSRRDKIEIVTIIPAFTFI